jgi:hypothetical protein
MAAAAAALQTGPEIRLSIHDKNSGHIQLSKCDDLASLRLRNGEKFFQ